ncbi:MAG: hypothetical protein JWP31_1424 [Aeromicrobium sp.]|nr:hypothetical protein [Aeromicrobium sp.]
MPYFATTYLYVADSDQARDTVRPAHRDYLGELTEQGRLLLSGPYVGGQPGALLVLDADSEDVVRELTTRDPFVLEGLVEQITVRTWQPVSGRLVSQT